jgi:LPS sulfotransferase NodH
VDGATGNLQLEEISARPLAFDLRHPGAAQELLGAATREAERVARAIQRIQSEAGYEVWYASDRDVPTRQTYDRLRALHSALTVDWQLVHGLIYGTISKDSHLRMKDWVARSGDTTLLDWMSHGVKDPETKKRYEVIDRCVASFEKVPGLAMAIALNEEKKKSKPWRKGTDGASPAQLESLDAEQIARLESSIDNEKKALEGALANPQCKDLTP